MKAKAVYCIAGVVAILSAVVLVIYAISGRNNVGNAVRALSCKQVAFPQSFRKVSDYTVTDSCCRPEALDSAYKILLFVDSGECLQCSVYLGRWKLLLREARLRYGEKIPFVFIFQPNDTRELVEYLRSVGFSHSVYVDENDEMTALNPFLKKYGIHAFLLDANNKIVCVGNPVHENRVWELYKQCIENSISCTAPEPEN